MTGRRSSVSLPIAHPKDDEHKFGAFVAANAAHAQTQTPRARPPTQAQNAETQTAIPPFSEAEQRDSSTAESPRKSAHVQTEALESSQAAHVQTQTFEARVFRRRSTSAPSVQFAQFQPKVLEPLQGDLVTSSSATDVIQSSKGPPQTSTPPSPRKENTTPRPELLTIPTQTSLPASPVGSRQISPRETPRACPRDVEAVPESERQEDYANPVALVGPGHADQKAAHSAETDHLGTQHRQEHEFHGGDTTFGIIEEANRSPGCDRDKHATRMSVRRRYVNSRELLGPSRTKKKAQMAKKGHGRYRNSPRSPGSTTPNSESSPTVTPRLCRKDRDATPRSARKGYQNPKALKPDHKYKRSHAQTQTQIWRSSSSVDPSDDVAEELPTTPRYCPRDRDPVPKSARRISPAARGRAIRKPQPPPSGIFQGCFGGCAPEESRKPFDTNPKYPSPKFPKVESSVTQHPNYRRGLNQKQVISQVLQEKIIPPAKPPPPRPPAAPAAVVPIGTQTEAPDPVPVAPKVVSSVGCCTVRPIGVATAVQVSSLPASCLPAGLKSTAARSKTRSPSPVHRKEPHTFYLKLKQITETRHVDKQTLACLHLLQCIAVCSLCPASMQMWWHCL